MKLRVLAVGQRMPDWVNAGTTEYAKRLPAHLNWQVIEIPLGFRGKSRTTDQAVAEEYDRLLSALSPSATLVALDVKGKSWSTPQLAVQLNRWTDSGSDVDIVIGGPDGLHPDLLARADVKWSLSPLTLPHPIVRVVLAEQIYRAHTINCGHPYHRV